VTACLFSGPLCPTTPKPECSAIVSQAEAIHRRILFTVGVSFALMLWSICLWLRLALMPIAKKWNWSPYYRTFPFSANWELILLIAAGVLMVSYLLRVVFSRWSQHELILTYGLTRVRTS
jgi:hypothetical protein